MQLNVYHFTRISIKQRDTYRSKIYFCFRSLAGPRNFVPPLRFCSSCFDHKSEMEGRSNLSDILN
jgi:hypothetical protein